MKVTNDTVLVPMTLQIHNKDITFNTKDGVSMGKVNILGRVSNLTGEPLQTFEDTVAVQTPSELLPQEQEACRCTGRRCRCARACTRSTS